MKWVYKGGRISEAVVETPFASVLSSDVRSIVGF